MYVQPFLIFIHWSYSKCKDILHTLNVCRIPAKEHPVVDWSAADAIWISEIGFGNYLECGSLILRN